MLISKTIWLAVSLLASLSACKGREALPAELSGVVYEAGSIRPLPGIYVLAEYREAGSDGGHSASWCVKTRGTYTDSQGRYSLPYGTGKWGPLVSIAAIDYHEAKIPARYQSTNATGTTKVDLFVQPRKLNELSRNRILVCQDAHAPTDKAANIEALKQIATGVEKHGSSPSYVESIRESIYFLEHGKYSTRVTGTPK